MGMIHRLLTMARNEGYEPNSLLGGIGIVQKDVGQHLERGRVMYQGSRWFAVTPAEAMIPAGTPVLVVGVINTTLVVEPI